MKAGNVLAGATGDYDLVSVEFKRRGKQYTYLARRSLQLNPGHLVVTGEPTLEGVSVASVVAVKSATIETTKGYDFALALILGRIYSSDVELSRSAHDVANRQSKTG